MNNKMQIATGFVAVLALIVSIFGVNYQKKENELAIHDMLIERNATLLGIMIENPDLRPFFYDDKDLSESDTEIVSKVMTLAELWTDLFEHVVIQLPNLPDKMAPSWEKYVLGIYKTSPAIQEHLDQNCREWYVADLGDLLDC